MARVLARKTHRPKKRDALRVFHVEAAPCQPCIQIEAARIVRRRAARGPLRYRPVWDASSVPPRTRERESLYSQRSPRLWNSLSGTTNATGREVAAAAVPHLPFPEFIFRAEEDGAGEDPQKRILQPFVMSAVGGHSPFHQNLRRAAESHCRALLPEAMVASYSNTSRPCPNGTP